MRVKDVNITKFFTDLPDVDLDWEPYGRDLVKDYIKKKYGYAYSCSVGTYTRMKLKTCIKDFSKIKGIPFATVNKLTKDIDDQVDYTFTDFISYATKSKQLYNFVQDNPDIVHMTKYALNVPKAESVHPSAVIIVPKENSKGEKTNLFNLMPIKKINGLLVSEWEGKYTESALFLKEDVLGLSQLSKFHDILNLIKKNTSKVLDVNKIKFDDQEVFKYFQRGWCEDVFQFGTVGLMNYCKQVKPTELSDLIAMTALFRPGPMDSGAHLDYAAIKNGKKKPKYDYGIKNITEETYSLLVYQEQMMSIIHQLGGLSLIEAENARKYIKKKKHKELNALGDRFKEGAIRNGCPSDEADKIWKKMNAFSGYSFNKSHAAAYSVMSYWSQWFKVNYPLEFWTTSLQYAKEEDIPYRLAEMRKTDSDIEVRPPDVNYSDKNFTCNKEDNRIFFSLLKIKHCGEKAVDLILQTRKEGGKFFNLEEFLSRVPSKVNKTVVKALIISGAFDLIEDISVIKDRKKILSKYLIDIRGEKELPEQYCGSDSMTNAFWIMEQKKLTGFGEVDYENYIENLIPNKLFSKLYVDNNEFSRVKEGKKVVVAGKVIYYNERDIKNGKMASLQIDCNNTIISIVIWPDCLERMTEDIEELKGSVIAISGIVKKDKFRNEKRLYSDSSTKLYILIK